MRSKYIERQIEKIYKEAYKKVFNNVGMTEAMKGSHTDIRNRILRLQESEKYKELCKEFAIRLSKAGINQQKGTWRKYYEIAKKNHQGVLPATYSKFEEKIMQEAVKHNFKMIKSIPQELLKVYQQKYVNTLIEQVAKGSVGRHTFEQQLKSHSHKNAKLIARTETAKLQTSILENRATKLGSVAYIWRSSNDKRTRQSHKTMNNVVVFWRKDSEKPLLDKMRGNAGEFPNCRCTPQPIVDESQLISSTYKVYDYRHDKIISMNKTKLLEALQKGEL